MDISLKVVIETQVIDWTKSPSAGVNRKPLERENIESGRTTSIVQYLPGSSFKTHSHPGGEEIFVLDGVFSDESGDYPAGSYLRNPIGSSHAPFSINGCILFVKLHQFQKEDLQKVIINTNEESWRAGHGGLEVMPLHSFGTESCALVKWPAGEKFLPHSHFGGEEIFVLKGTFKDES
jgi:anti-sigma factor ChrR (cupin superfamily)